MGPYHIHKINNETRKVTVLSDKGHKIDITIPEAHTTHEAKAAYLQGHVHGHVNASNKSIYKQIGFIVFSVVQIIIVAAVIYLKGH